MSTIRWGLYYWPWALLTISMIIGGPELFALFTNPANTLSEYSWGELHVNSGQFIYAHTAAWYVSLIVTILLMVTLVLHIWFKRFV